MKKWKIFVLLLGVFLLVFTISNVTYAASNMCYRAYYNWYCIDDGNFNYRTWGPYALWVLYNDGTFESLTSGGYGYWGYWGASAVIQFESGCAPLYSGTKTQGFMQCTDGSSYGDFPGCYVLKKTKWTECANYYILEKSEKNLEASDDSKP